MGGPPPSSNAVNMPPDCTSTSCWNAVCVPAPILKLFWLVPSVQITAPVLWSTLYTPQVFRIDTIRLPSLSIEIEFRWYGSYTNPGAPFLKNDWVIGM